MNKRALVAVGLTLTVVVIGSLIMIQKWNPYLMKIQSSVKTLPVVVNEPVPVPVVPDATGPSVVREEEDVLRVNDPAPLPVPDATVRHENARVTPVVMPPTNAVGNAHLTPAVLPPANAVLTPRNDGISQVNAVLTPRNVGMSQGNARVTLGNAVLTPRNDGMSQGNARVTLGNAVLTPGNAGLRQETAIPEREQTSTFTYDDYARDEDVDYHLAQAIANSLEDVPVIVPVSETLVQEERSDDSEPIANYQGLPFIRDFYLNDILNTWSSAIEFHKNQDNLKKNSFLTKWLSQMKSIAPRLRSTISQMSENDLNRKIYEGYSQTEMNRLKELWNALKRDKENIFQPYSYNDVSVSDLIQKKKSDAKVEVEFNAADPHATAMTELLFTRSVTEKPSPYFWRYFQFYVKGIYKNGVTNPVLDAGGGRRELLSTAVAQLTAVLPNDLPMLQQRSLLPLKESSMSLNLNLFEYADSNIFGDARKLAKVWMGTKEQHSSPAWKAYLNHCRYLGRLIGFMLMEQHRDTKMYFVPSFYKAILGLRVTTNDAMQEDPKLIPNWRAIPDPEISLMVNDRYDDFAYGMIDVNNGKHVEVSLKDFSDSPVFDLTRHNFDAKFDVLIQFLLVDIYALQYQEIRLGLHDFIPEAEMAIRFPTWESLRDALSGPRLVDIVEWKRRTRYFDLNSKMKEWFWRYVENADEEKRRSVLNFMTASETLQPGDKEFYVIPITESYTTSADPERATPKRLPQSATCGFTLMLRDYDSYEEFESEMNLVIANPGTIEDRRYRF